VHNTAGGTGTYANPITLATDAAELPVGTRVYVPYLQKYFIMEDDCTQCDADWNKGVYHIDLWIGGQGYKTVRPQADALTQAGSQLVIINPPPDEVVNHNSLLAEGSRLVSSLKGRGCVNGVLTGFWLSAGVRDWRLLFP
jgi:hypothetical protein